MHLLVIGQSGQLARALRAAHLPDAGWRVTSVGRPALDITDRNSVSETIAGLAPDIVVNAAAYTAVDKAESEPEAAFAVNRDGAENVAEATAKSGAPLIHISTDYVFSGNANRPWRESDPVAPLGVYGQSKLDGEIGVAKANPRHVILRTSWVHSPWGSNFVKTMLRLGAERDELRIVGDQTGTPSYAPDLADAIVAIAGQALNADRAGVFHLTNAGSTSWYDFAAEIFRAAAAFGAKTPNLVRIPTRDYPTPAQRPAYSVLDNSKVGEAFGIHMRDWRAGAKACVEALMAASAN